MLEQFEQHTAIELGRYDVRARYARVDRIAHRRQRLAQEAAHRQGFFQSLGLTHVQGLNLFAVLIQYILVRENDQFVGMNLTGDR